MMMMAASSAAAFYGMREEDDQRQMKQQHSSTLTSSTAPSAPPQKKRRNQPNPDAEVIALSPKTLMATNRFICEVCNKGFQREQNLQLHRRGHNLPWKLRQKSTKDEEDQVVKKKVYLCPEPTCVHHDPSRPLSDLTGIKKHYSRKHGEKKYKCDKCSKKYAVHSDWKAHSKTCGTREYRCDCGTLFSRRDSFITHRAFCDALAQESARHDQPTLSTIGSHLHGSSASNMNSGLSQMSHGIFSIQDDENQPTIDILRLRGDRTGEFGTMIAPTNNDGSSFRPTQSMPSSSVFFNMPESNQDYHEDQNQTQHVLLSNEQYHGLMLQLPDLQNNTNNPSSAANIFNLSFLSNISSNVDSMDNRSNANANSNLSSSLSLLFPNQFNGTEHASEGSGTQFSGNIMGTQITSGIPSLYSSPLQNNNNNNVANSHMSATALLQKAAQTGSTTSSNINSTASLLKGYKKSDTPPVAANFGGENNKNHLHHDLMKALAGGSQLSTFFGNAYGGHEQENTTYGGYIC